jgi:hypothetical protein
MLWLKIQSKSQKKERSMGPGVACVAKFGLHHPMAFAMNVTFKKEAMMYYLCELIDKGIVKERFSREGSSAEEVKKDLDMFQWPNKGKWRISIPEDQD